MSNYARKNSFETYLWNSIIVIILWRQESRARHCGSEEWRGGISIVCNDVLDDGTSSCGLSPNGDLRWVPSKFADLQGPELNTSKNKYQKR